MKYLKQKSKFLLDKEFESIIYDILSIKEKGNIKWVDNNTVVWDFDERNKLKRFLSKLDKNQIKKYFKKFAKYVSKLPSKTKKKILLGAISVFLIFLSPNDLLSSDIEINDLIRSSISGESDNMAKEKLKGSEFSKAQEMVKQGEGGYTDDKNDSGNWIDGKLVGTNHGISAQELKSHLGRTPTKEEMEDLSYEDALDIYEDKFWKRYNLGHFHNQSVANLIYDGIVNQGQNGMKKVLQKVLKDFDITVKLRNIYGIRTIEKMNKLDQEELFNKIMDYRWSRYQGSKKFKIYGDGWRNRIDKFNFKE